MGNKVWKIKKNRTKNYIHLENEFGCKCVNSNWMINKKKNMNKLKQSFYSWYKKIHIFFKSKNLKTINPKHTKQQQTNKQKTIKYHAFALQIWISFARALNSQFTVLKSTNRYRFSNFSSRFQKDIRISTQPQSQVIYSPGKIIFDILTCFWHLI